MGTRRLQNMNTRRSLFLFNLISVLWIATALQISWPAALAYARSAGAEPGAEQGGPSATAASAQAGPVSYASVTELNGVLSQLEAASKTTQGDLSKLRI